MKKKLFEITATEYNGEQEYSHNYAVWAKDIDEATKITRQFFNDWYGDDGEDHTCDSDPDNFEYDNGIVLHIYGIEEITKIVWMQRMIDRYTIAS